VFVFCFILLLPNICSQGHKESSRRAPTLTLARRCHG
jgi:hypothetical protein